MMKSLAKVPTSVAGGLLLLVVGCGSPVPEAPTASTVPPLVVFRPAVVANNLVSLHASPGGELVTDWSGEYPYFLQAGRPIAVLGDPVEGPGGRWFRVYLEPTLSDADDLYGWLPDTLDGRSVLTFRPSERCGEPTTASLGRILGLTRLACYGGAPLTLEGRTWLAGRNDRFVVDPGWFAYQSADAPAFSLIAAPPAEASADALLAGMLSGELAWIDVRHPPDVALPPLDVVVRVEGRFDHPAAAGCRRTVDRVAFPDHGLPDEAPADSATWCRMQFVASGWTVVTGPEGRPIDPLRPQLHHVASSSGSTACVTDELPPLRFRIDPSAPEPVWIEGDDRGALLTFDEQLNLVL
jgi:hypothetical protein